jgi:fused signal recognition particle receptor
MTPALTLKWSLSPVTLACDSRKATDFYPFTYTNDPPIRRGPSRNSMLGYFKKTHPPVADQPQEARSWAARLRDSLARTRSQMGGRLSNLFGRGGKIDEALYEELETILITADVGVGATAKLLADVKRRVKQGGLTDTSQVKEALQASLLDLLMPLEKPLDVTTHKPFVIMLAGVNGAGKTTTIGKLAKYFQGQGKSVLLAAGDTFRAAAVEQLQVWGERNGVVVVTQEKGDSAAVIFDAIQSARAKGIDIVLADTAGRLPTQLHLMEEIKKVKRVIAKAEPTAPHEVLLVLDANTGQNAVSQVKSFDDALALTGLVVTKLDGTAKGGALAAIAATRPVPVRYIGIGETIDDLRPFVARDFVSALFE